MNSGPFKNVTRKVFVYKSYSIQMYKEDLELKKPARVNMS